MLLYSVYFSKTSTVYTVHCAERQVQSVLYMYTVHSVQHIKSRVCCTCKLCAPYDVSTSVCAVHVYMCVKCVLYNVSSEVCVVHVRCAQCAVCQSVKHRVHTVHNVQCV